ncbi:conserved hypothetical protein [Neospora caninum Liverpool]|uniref:Uncharacterized protein n=1 Tax=Neospora caninum (strain Liverpool) TaxID=572307 RepID=F0VG84_NEOCL|nr:conserved hypothetical protein [Neospora caninum Liverpool]CBZ52728.1 conserved hypothetical protein [Neospora caninum Liverpool]CEL66709.1 TPA: hypothetical protein BN1204_025180 [Neospora caninum Liverpool]|eukprot:XP_003882760.1 conserved hypothetical protein [Neospora caninum Liverpool]
MWSGLPFASPPALSSAPGCEGDSIVITVCSSQAAYFAGDVYRGTLQVRGPVSAFSFPVAVSVSVQLCGVLSTSTSRRRLLDSPALNRYRHAALPFYRSGGKGGGAAAGDQGVPGKLTGAPSCASSASASALPDRLPVCAAAGVSDAGSKDPIFPALFSSSSKLLFLSDLHVVTDTLVFEQPGVTFSFGYECCLPPFLPPTFNGCTTKINYYLCLTGKKRVPPQSAVGKPAAGLQQMSAPAAPTLSTAFLRLPIRLLGSPNRHMPILPTLGPPVLPATRESPLSTRSVSAPGTGFDGSSPSSAATQKQTPASPPSSASLRSRFFLPNVLRVFGTGSASASSRPTPREASPAPAVSVPFPQPVAFHFHSRTWEGGDLAAQAIKSVNPAALDDRVLPESLGADIAWLLGGHRERDAFPWDSPPSCSLLASLSSPPCALQEMLGLWNASRNTREYGTAYVDVLCASSVPPLWAERDACADSPWSSVPSKRLPDADSTPASTSEGAAISGLAREFDSAGGFQARKHDRGSSSAGGGGEAKETVSDSDMMSDTTTPAQKPGGSSPRQPGDSVIPDLAPDSLPSPSPAPPGPAQRPPNGLPSGRGRLEDSEGSGEQNSLPCTPSQPSYAGVSTAPLPLLRIVVDGDNDAPSGMPGEAGIQRREQFRISRSGQFLCLVSLPGVPFLSLTRFADSRRPAPIPAVADPSTAAPCVRVGGCFSVRLSFEGATARTHEVHLSVVREETPLRPPASAATSQQALGSHAGDDSRPTTTPPSTTRTAWGGAASRGEQDAAARCSPDGPTVAQVVWEQQEVVASMEEVSLVAHVPTTCPPSFETDTVRVTYALVFQFLCAGEPAAAQAQPDLGESCEATPALRGKLSRDDVVGLSWELPLIVLPPFGNGASREDPQGALWVGGGWEAVGDAAGVAAHELKLKVRAWQVKNEQQVETETDADVLRGGEGCQEGDHPAHQLDLLYSASGIALLLGDGAKSLHRGVFV